MQVSGELVLCQIKKTFYNTVTTKCKKNGSARKLGANLHTFANKPRPHLHAPGPKRLWERAGGLRALLALCLGLRCRLQGVRLALWALLLFGPQRQGEYSTPARGIGILPPQPQCLFWVLWPCRRSGYRDEDSASAQWAGFYLGTALSLWI